MGLPGRSLTTAVVVIVALLVRWICRSGERRRRSGSDTAMGANGGALGSDGGPTARGCCHWHCWQWKKPPGLLLSFLLEKTHGRLEVEGEPGEARWLLVRRPAMGGGAMGEFG